MDTRKITSEYRLSQWAQILQERQASGLSIIDFCQKKEINKNTYFYWQRKLREAACTELAKNPEEFVNLVPSGWAQLSSKQLQSQHLKATLDIEISGCHVTVNSETNLELLKKVCHVLRSL